MNQPNHYMPDVAQSGCTRCFFTASYAHEVAPTDIEESSRPPSIVLCIDRNATSQLKSDTSEASVPDVVANTFEAAIALAEQDPLLQYVANWLKQDLEWVPLDLSESLAVDVTLSSSARAAHKIGLSFSHGANDLPPPPIELDELVLVHTHKQSLSVCLAQLSLSAGDQQRLQPGSCILLPETFKQTTALNLFDLQSTEIVRQVVLDRSQNRLVQSTNGPDNESVSNGVGENLTPITSTTSTKETLTRVFLQQPVTIDMSSTATHIDLEPLVGQMVVIQCERSDGVAQYAAQLIEVGSGLAALLDSPR